jgi:hypothetical protein
MAKNDYWESMNPTRYYTILLGLVITFLILTGITILTNTFWTIIFVLPYSLAMPIMMNSDSQYLIHEFVMFS